jgi:DNA-binding beta-propeller fold protein YncE
MPSRGTTRHARALAIGLLATVLAACAAAPAQAGGTRRTTEVIFAGSNWEGTVEVIRPHKPFRRIAQINVIPDIEERLAEMLTDPERLAYFVAIAILIGEGNNQYVDDMYTSKDGRLLIASRPSLADVVGISLRTGEIVWRFPVAGQRSDHMALSPDGRNVAVSASTGNVVHILNVRTGEEIGRFESGDSPHENVYSKDGERIYHASIGLVYTPVDQPLADSTKGDRWFQIVDADTNEILERIDMGKELAKAGYPNMSSAVRPMAITPNEKRVFFQVSFFHGFVEYNLVRKKVVRVIRLPNLIPNTPREAYLLDSAHHGIALSGDAKKLCVAGTMDDYVAMVNRRSLKRAHPSYKLLKLGEKPYWATTMSDGRRCMVSWSGSDKISIISYRTGKLIADVPVGNHPQRVRMGYVRKAWIAAQG